MAQLDKIAERLSVNADETLKARLAAALAAEKAVEKLADRNAAEQHDLTPEEVLAVRKREATFLETAPVTVERAALIQTAAELLGVLADETSGHLDSELIAQLKAINWDRLLPEGAETLAGTDPEVLLQKVTDEAKFGPEVTDYFVIPVLSLAIRVFLTKAAKKGSRLLASFEDNEEHFTLQPWCPVCGGSPVMARIADTKHNGAQRRLICGTCGADWQWNRIGCPVCGLKSAKDFEYLSPEGDDRHRLYVCHGCESVLPTVFAGDEDELLFNAGLESVMLQDLAENYQAGKEEKRQ